MLHTIIALRRRYQTAVIFISKFDFKSAYWHLHLQAQMALQCTVTTIGLENEPIALASLRATFGGKPCPFLFSEVSESVTNLSNAIVRCPSWDPKLLRPTHSELLGVPRREDPNLFAQTETLVIMHAVLACTIIIT